MEQIIKEQRAQIGLGELVTVGVSLVIIGLVFTFGTDIVVDVRDDFTSASTEWNYTNDTVRALGEIPKKLPTIALIIAVAVIITVLTRAFMKAA
jgi:hypothetical protein